MEPDFILNQVKSLRQVLVANMKEIQEKRIGLEDTFLHPQLLLDQVDGLENVIRDSLLLHKDGDDPDKLVISNSDLPMLVGHVQTALKDRTKLQNASSDAKVRLATMVPAFALEVAKALNRTVQRNSAQIQNETDLNKISMSQPQFATKTVGWLYHVMYTHASLLAQITSLRDINVTANAALRSSTQEIERLTSLEKASTKRIAELETSLEKLCHDNMRLNEAANAVDGATQARLHKVSDELASLQSLHRDCGQQLEERNAEIIQLRIEHKNLVLRHGEVSEAASGAAKKAVIMEDELKRMQSERDKLSAELLEIKESYDAFRLARAQEYDAVIAETAQLDETRVAATQEREENERLLGNAARKIEELENKLRSKDEELSKLRDALTLSERANQTPRTPISPPPSGRKSVSTASKKRKAAGRDTTVSWSQGDAGYSLNLAAHASPMPPRRLNELAQLPEVAVDLGSPDALPAIFTRQSLSNILGGSIQGLVVRCTESATDLARSHDIQDYLCPNMDHNAWSPAGPGKHGYMQVGLGRDRKLFNDQGDHRHVFVGAGKLLLYCGWYHVLRVEPLTKDEWGNLPDKVKTTYSETTVNKEKSDRFKSTPQVLAMYNSGELRAPCVRLQCLEFDTAFYHELVRANDQFFSNKPRPGPPTNGSKRRKLNGDLPQDDTKDEDEDKDKTVEYPPAESSGTGPSRWVSESPLTTIGETPSRSVSTAAQAVHTSSTPVPETAAGSSTSTPARSTRSTLRLRIPGGRSTQSPTVPQDVHAEEAEVEMELSESESDDDDLYADE
ncbi:hypothetical protein GSI_06322 [Ganoderma sinense ZZ0214-1]|uniref:DUF6697 domain-containing protein n=1 Tax=Ganoderma sinense ZZ0214-1 TaxID=1077348 RepID=A0A2G8SCY3_9APHY|nr:hypothetical protein GSI_06322 [Ganoderma sinense ZZ0214-1]